LPETYLDVAFTNDPSLPNTFRYLLSKRERHMGGGGRGGGRGSMKGRREQKEGRERESAHERERECVSV